mgnify:CR=1 FL=1
MTRPVPLCRRLLAVLLALLLVLGLAPAALAAASCPHPYRLLSQGRRC